MMSNGNPSPCMGRFWVMRTSRYPCAESGKPRRRSPWAGSRAGKGSLGGTGRVAAGRLTRRFLCDCLSSFCGAFFSWNGSGAEVDAFESADGSRPLSAHVAAEAAPTRMEVKAAAEAAPPHHIGVGAEAEAASAGCFVGQSSRERVRQHVVSKRLQSPPVAPWAASQTRTPQKRFASP